MVLKELAGLLDDREAAARIGISVSALRSWRYLGRGPRAVRVLGRVRYEAKEVGRFVRERRRLKRRAPLQTLSRTERGIGSLSPTQAKRRRAALEELSARKESG
jgi:hypothetical protein